MAITEEFPWDEKASALPPVLETVHAFTFIQ